MVNLALDNLSAIAGETIKILILVVTGIERKIDRLEERIDTLAERIH